MFSEYDFNLIENLSLVSLWNYIYKLKFSTEKYAEIKFSGFLKQIIRQLALLTPNLKLESQAVLNVLEVELGTAVKLFKSEILILNNYRVAVAIRVLEGREHQGHVTTGRRKSKSQGVLVSPI